MIAFHAYQPQGERFFQRVMRELCIGKNLLLCETWRRALFTGAVLFRLPLKDVLTFCRATCLWCQLSKVWSHLQINIVIYNVTFWECSRVVGFAFRRARGVLRQWDVEALCHKVKPQLPHICKWSLRDGMLESVGKWKPISATTSQLDWDGLAFLSGGPESGTSTDIQPVKESTDPLVQLHHEWPLGVIPSKLSEGGTLSLLYNCSCSSHIECFKAVCRLTDHC